MNVRVELTGPTGVITLERPHRRNALSDELVRQIQLSIDELEANESVRSLIIKGSEPGFCAGSDLYELSPMTPSAMSQHELRTAALARRLGQTRLITFAAVEGFAIGGGLFFCASFDVVIAGEGVKWSLPEIEHGWIPPWGLESLVGRVGGPKSKQMVLQLWSKTTTEAHHLGLVDVVVEDGQTFQKAIELANWVAELPPDAVMATKEFFTIGMQRDSEMSDAVASGLFKRNVLQTEPRKTMDKFRQRQDREVR